MSAHLPLPYMFRRAGPHTLVLMIDPSRLDWRAGFFSHSLPKERPVDAVVPFDEWLAQAEGDTDEKLRDFSDTAAIFHVSRCGSTLLAQNLKSAGALVLSEPPFMRILRECNEGSVRYAHAIRAVAAVVARWQAWARERGRPLVVKFNSQAHEFRADLMGALPGARFAFLHREPLPVFESLGRNPPQYLLREDIRWGSAAAQAEYERRTDDPLLAAAAARYVATIEAFATIDEPGLMMVGYQDLASRYAGIADHLLGRQRVVERWDAAPDAKAAGADASKRYVPVARETLSQFAQAHHRLLTHAEAHYARFCERQSDCSAELSRRSG